MMDNKNEALKQRCDYPGCHQPATIQCGMIGCMHQVCEVHGNCGYEETPDHPPVTICWGCGGKGWGQDMRYHIGLPTDLTDAERDELWRQHQHEENARIGRLPGSMSE